jgi:hypothetical protein
MLKALSILACLLLGTTGLQAAETSIAEKLQKQIRACLTLPEATYHGDLRIKIEFTLDAKGAIVSDPVPLVAPKSSVMKSLIEAGKRAIVRCAPYPIAANETVRVNFVP